MKKVKMKNGEFVNLFNGLNEVKSLPGVKFGLLVAKNLRIIETELKDIETFSQPSAEFVELSRKYNELKESGADEKKLNKLEKDNDNIIKARQKQIDEVNSLLSEEVEIQLHSISEEALPESITGQQIINIDKIIE